MPSTARVVIAQADANNYITLNVDDVLSTPVGKHSSFTIPIGSSDLIWPATGETFAYLRMAQGAQANTVSMKTVPADAGWSFTIPLGQKFVPLIVPKPSTGTYTITTTQPMLVSVYYF